MSIVAQAGVVLLIVCIVFILIRSNRGLAKAAEEGEYFIDEWEEQQRRKEERLLLRQEKKMKKTGIAQKDFHSGEEDREVGQMSGGETQEDKGNLPEWEEKKPEASSKIVSMAQYKNPGIVLVEMDEEHRPVRRIRVSTLPFTIGRRETNSLVLDDLCVARDHGRIVERDGAYVLEDVGTANKIFVNGVMADRVVLSDKLRFYIGNVELMAELEAGRSCQTHLYQRTGEHYYE